MTSPQPSPFTETPLVMATTEQTLAFLTQVNTLLGRLGAQVAHVVLSGDVNTEQQAYVRHALSIVDGLRALFTAEHARQSGSPASHSQES